MMNNCVLKIEKLLIGYKKVILPEINLSANNHDFICILGKNGVGKTTFLKTIVGIISGKGGNIFLGEKNLSDLSNRIKSTLISFVPSQLEYFSNLTVYELVSLGRSPYTNIFDNKNEKDIEIIEQAIRQLNLIPLKNKALYEISDGERQRTMICRAIVQQTPIIVLDEPTAFLDYPTKKQITQDLKQITQGKNLSVIFSTHDIALALRYSTKIWLFDKNVEEFDTKELSKTNKLKEILDF